MNTLTEYNLLKRLMLIPFLKNPFYFILLLFLADFYVNFKFKTFLRLYDGFSG